MLAYIIRRLLLIIPTLFGVMLVNFIVIQAAPGGPVEQVIAMLKGHDMDATSRFSGTGQGDNLSNRSGNTSETVYRGAQGLDEEFIKQLEKQFGFDKPVHERFLLMMGNYQLKIFLQ